MNNKIIFHLRYSTISMSWIPMNGTEAFPVISLDFKKWSPATPKYLLYKAFLSIINKNSSSYSPPPFIWIICKCRERSEKFMRHSLVSLASWTVLFIDKQGCNTYNTSYLYSAVILQVLTEYNISPTLENKYLQHSPSSRSINANFAHRVTDRIKSNSTNGFMNTWATFSSI